MRVGSTTATAPNVQLDDHERERATPLLPPPHALAALCKEERWARSAGPVVSPQLYRSASPHNSSASAAALLECFHCVEGAGRERERLNASSTTTTTTAGNTH